MSVLVSLLGVGPGVAHAEPRAPGSSPSPFCAWQLMSNSQVMNVAFPDANATYWVLPYALAPGDSITLTGKYPRARYFSLNTYGTDLDTVDTLRDNQIRPDRGGVNPYTEAGAEAAAARGAAGSAWRATVVNRTPDKARNEIRGLPAGGQRAPIGSLIIRIYVPDDARSPSGGVSLPTVTMRTGGAAVTLRPCAQPFDPKNYPGPIAAATTRLFDAFLQDAASGAFPAGAPDAKFINPASTAGLFPNGDNKYIGAGLKYRKGRVAVIRGKAPSFPNTRAGASPAQPGKDLRYWAMCQNDKVSPYPVVACAADFQTRLDADGYYTYVVAAPADRAGLNDPALTLIPWGDTSVPEKVVFLRNMLPSSGYYPWSVQASQAGGGDPQRSMGEYYPRAVYCSAELLSTQGWRACYR